MQLSNPLIDVLCLVALIAFATSAILAVALLLRRHKQNAVPRSSAMPPEPAITSPVAMPPMNNGAMSPALPDAAIPMLLPRLSNASSSPCMPSCQRNC